MIGHRILGTLEVVVDDGVLDLAAAKQRALVCLLVLGRGRPLSRDELIDRLWAGAPPRSAVQTLQSYIANLRRVYEPGVASRDATILMSRAGGYALEVGALDADAFERDHAAGRESLRHGDTESAIRSLRSALDRWRGTPLPELPDDPAAIAERNRLDQLRLSAIEDLAQARVDSGELAIAAASLRHLLVEHPLRERARGLLALACYRDGRQAEALDVLSEGRRVLADELGLDPGPELQRLEQAILRQDAHLDAAAMASTHAVSSGASNPTVSGNGSPPPEPARPPRRGPVSGVAPPLIGRDEELGTLEDAMVRGGITLLAGEPGIGKTRLLSELAQRAQPGRLVLLGRCPDAEGVPPHWPWRQVLSGVRGDLGAVREVNGPFAVGMAVAERLRLAAREQPLLVVLEDVHWADEASLRVLQVVAEELHADPASIAVSFRTEDAGRAPLVDTLAALARLPMVSRLDLQGLDEVAVAAYVESVTGTPVEHGQAAALAERTAGNPFFLGELARLGTEVEGLPPGLRDVIRLRVGRLPDAAVDVLRVGALLGRDVPLRIVATVSDVDPVRLLEAVDTIVASGLASEPVAGRLRFTHALVREALLDDLSGLRRAVLHGRIADALERAGADPAALAHHRVEAAVDGQDDRAARACLVAARRAMDELAVEQTAKLATTGLGLASPNDADLRCDLRLLEGAARRRLGDLDGAIEALDDALALARGLGDATRFAEVALTRAGGTVQGFWTTPVWGDADLAAVLEEAQDGLGEEDVGLQACVLAELVMQRQLDGRSHEARATAARAASLAALADDREASIASLRASYAAARPAALDEQFGIVASLLALAAGRADVVVAALMMRANLLLASGRIDEADQAAAEATSAAERDRLPDLLLLCDAWRIRRCLLVGSWDEAETLWREMSERAQHLGPASERLALDEWTSVRGLLAWQRGGFEQLVDTIDERSRSSTNRWRAVVPLALTEAGRADEASAMIERIVASDDGGLAFRAIPIQGVVWLSETVAMLGGHPRAAELLAELEPLARQLLVPRLGVGCLGSVAHYTGGLRRVLGDLDGAARDLTEAVDRNVAAGARPFAARSRQRLAAVVLDRAGPGDVQLAGTLWRQAHDDAVALGMAPLRRELEEMRRRHALTGVT